MGAQEERKEDVSMRWPTARARQGVLFALPAPNEGRNVWTNSPFSAEASW